LDAGARRYLIARRHYIDSYGADDSNRPDEMGWRLELGVRGRKSVLWQMLMGINLLTEGVQKTDVYLYATTSLLGCRREVGVVLTSERAFGPSVGQGNSSGLAQLILTEEGKWV
jgi:hypothetical protein